MQDSAEPAPTGFGKLPQELINQIAEKLVPSEIHVKRFDLGGGKICFEPMDSSLLTDFMSLIRTKTFQAAALDCNITLHVWIAGEGAGRFRARNEIPAYILKCVTAVHFHFLDAKTEMQQPPPVQFLRFVRRGEVGIIRRLRHLRRVTAVFARSTIDHNAYNYDGILIAAHSRLSMDPCQASERLRDYMTSSAIFCVQRLATGGLHRERHVTEEAKSHKLEVLLCAYGTNTPMSPIPYLPGFGSMKSLRQSEALDLLKNLQGHSNEFWHPDPFVCPRES